MNAVKSIWHEIYVPPKMSDEDSETAYVMAEKVNQKYDALASVLSNEVKEMLGEYVEAFEEYESFLESTAFESGFKTAIQLMLEGMSKT